MSQDLTEKRWYALHELLKGWRWCYKGRPVGRWAEEYKIKWKEDKPCVS